MQQLIEESFFFLKDFPHILRVPGDAYRFTLQPVFLNLKNEFRCHIRRLPSSYLYQVWFDIIIPGTDLSSPRFRSSVRSSAPEEETGSGRFVVEFLTVEHISGLIPEDEFVLLGRETSGRWDHSVISLRSRPEAPKRIPFHMISNNIFVLTTQFEEPFAYSTSTWVDETGCDKNTRMFRPVPRSDDAQNVSVVTLIGDRSAYEYRLKSVDNPPQLKFTIPGLFSYTHIDCIGLKLRTSQIFDFLSKRICEHVIWDADNRMRE